MLLLVYNKTGAAAADLPLHPGDPAPREQEGRPAPGWGARGPEEGGWLGRQAACVGRQPVCRHLH